MPELTLYATGYGSTIIKKGKKDKGVEIKFSYQMDGDKCTLYPLDDDVDEKNFEGELVKVSFPNEHNNEIEKLTVDGFIVPNVAGESLQKLKDWDQDREIENEEPEEPVNEDDMDEKESNEEVDTAGEEEPAHEVGRKKAWPAGKSKKFVTKTSSIPVKSTGTGSSHKRMGRVLHKKSTTNTNLFAGYQEVVRNLTEEEALVCLIWRDDLNSYTLRFINRLSGRSEQREYKLDIDEDNETLIFNDINPVPMSSESQGIAYALISDPGQTFDFSKKDLTELQIHKNNFCQFIQEINDEDESNSQVDALNEAVGYMVDLRDAQPNHKPDHSGSVDDPAVKISGGKPSPKQAKEPAKEFKKIDDDMAKDFKSLLIQELSKLHDDQGNALIDKTLSNEIFVNRDSKKGNSYFVSLPNEIEKHVFSANEVKSRTKVYFNAESGYINGDIVKFDSETGAIKHFDYRSISALFIQTFYNLKEIQQCEFPWTVTLNFGKMGIPAQPPQLRQEVTSRINEIVEKVSKQLEIPDKLGLSLANDKRINLVDVDKPAPAANTNNQPAPDANSNPQKQPRNP